MKKLRILFLAVLATALVVSGAFADVLPKASFDNKIEVSNKETVTYGDGLASVDLWSGDKTLKVSFDFSALTNYTITWKADDGFALTSDEKTGKVNATLTVPATAKSGDKFVVTLTLTSTDTGSGSDTPTPTDDTTVYAYAGTAVEAAYYSLTPEVANKIDALHTYEYDEDEETYKATNDKAPDNDADGNPKQYYSLAGELKFTMKGTYSATDTANTAVYYEKEEDDEGGLTTYKAVGAFVQPDTGENAEANTYYTVKGTKTNDTAAQAAASTTKHYYTFADGTYTLVAENANIVEEAEEAEEGKTLVTDCYELADDETITVEPQGTATYYVNAADADGNVFEDAFVLATNDDFTQADTTKNFYTVTGTADVITWAPLDGWDEEVTGSETQKYALANEDSTVYTLADTTSDPQDPADVGPYYIITPVDETANVKGGSTGVTTTFLFDEGTGTYTQATAQVPGGYFSGYSASTTYYTAGASERATDVSSTADLGNGVYYLSGDVWTHATEYTGMMVYTVEFSEASAVEVGKVYYQKEAAADAEETTDETTGTTENTITGVFDDMTLRQSYATDGGTTKTYTLTFTVTYRGKAGSSEGKKDEETAKGTPGIDWASASAINNKTWTIYLSADKAGVEDTVKVAVSSDFTAAPALVISPDKNDYVKFAVGTAAKSTSSDKRGTVYTIDMTATPLSADAKGSTFTVYATVTSGSVYKKTSELSVKVIVSDDTKGNVTPGDDVVTDWELTVEADEKSFDLNWYEKATVTITAKPSDVAEVTFSDDSDEDEGYTLEGEEPVKGTTAYTKVYTFTAGEEDADYDITFTVKATSGDKTETKSVKVTFSVAFDADDQVAPEEPEDLAATLGGTDQTVGGHTFHIDTVTERDEKFKAGKGVVGWGLKAPYKVRPVFGPLGWWFRFLNALLNTYFDLNAPQTFGASVVSIAASDDVTSGDSALKVGFDGDDTAYFELDLEKAAATLPEGATYKANSSYTPEATAEEGGKASEEMTAGELKGTKASTPEPEPEPTPTPTDGELLGGSSGGCDAGFGALALALAASMIFVRKRS